MPAVAGPLAMSGVFLCLFLKQTSEKYKHYKPAAGQSEKTIRMQ